MSSLKLCTPTFTPLLTNYYNKPRFSQPLHIRAQIHRDHHEGRRSKNMVDSNLQQLKARIDEVRNKERLERCCVAAQGWNYAAHVETFKAKRDRLRQQHLSEFLELIALVGSTFGFTILGSSSCLCIISLLIHFNQ